MGFSQRSTFRSSAGKNKGPQNPVNIFDALTGPDRGATIRTMTALLAAALAGLLLPIFSQEEESIVGANAPPPAFTSRPVDNPSASFVEKIEARRFFKGNLHSHSNDHQERGYGEGKGDGDVPPEEVLAAYAGLGYAFASVTDHNQLTVVPGSGITALKGIELTSHYGSKPTKPVHVNVVCVDRQAKGIPGPGKSGAAVLQETISIARQTGASLVVVNHPNYAHALTQADLAASPGFNAIELASGHAATRKDDAEALQSAESIWDDLLTSGREVWGLAADDAHHFKGGGHATPNRAWIEAWADSASEADLCRALREGHFFASTGPRLDSLVVRGNSMTVLVSGVWNPKADKVEFLSRKTGENESIAAVGADARASYLLAGSEGYVRARITQAGKRAWTQAYRVR